MIKFHGVVWALLLFVGGTVLLLFFNFNGGADDLILPEKDSLEQINHAAKVTTRRKLKDGHGFHPPSVRVRTNGQIISIEDYDPIDPVPSSKTSVKHGPIQHGSPLIPYLPKPSPPDYPPSP